MLGAAAPPPAGAPTAVTTTPPPSPPPPPSSSPAAEAPLSAPEGWTLVVTRANGGCAAKTAPVDGISFGITLSRVRGLSLLFAGASWKLGKDVYDVPVRIDDLPANTVSMFGSGQALIAQLPPDLRAPFMTAGKIGFHFTQKDFAIPVHDIAGVVSSLETCVAQHYPTTPADPPADKPAEKPPQ